MALGALDYGLAAFTQISAFGNALSNDRRSRSIAMAQARRNNQLAERNYQLINEEAMAEMVARGNDKFVLAREVRSAKASARVRMGEDGALSSQSMQKVFQDIEREGGYQAQEIDYNFGRRLRNLEIERQNNAITTAGLNAEAFNQITQSASIGSLVTGLSGLALSGLKEENFTLDVASGRTVPKFSPGQRYNYLTDTFGD